jgi:integral membrane protein
MLKILKIAAILEGISSFLLYFVSMPSKYLINNEKSMPFIGAIHGFLFCVFIVVALYVAIKQKWSLSKVYIAFMCAVFPCGTFCFENEYLKNA